MLPVRCRVGAHPAVSKASTRPAAAELYRSSTSSRHRTSACQGWRPSDVAQLFPAHNLVWLSRTCILVPIQPEPSGPKSLEAEATISRAS